MSLTWLNTTFHRRFLSSLAELLATFASWSHKSFQLHRNSLLECHPVDFSQNKQCFTVSDKRRLILPFKNQLYQMTCGANRRDRAWMERTVSRGNKALCETALSIIIQGAMPKSSREALRVQRSALNSAGGNWSQALLLHLEKWSFSIPAYFLSGMQKKQNCASHL